MKSRLSTGAGPKPTSAALGGGVGSTKGVGVSVGVGVGSADAERRQLLSRNRATTTNRINMIRRVGNRRRCIKWDIVLCEKDNEEMCKHYKACMSQWL